MSWIWWIGIGTVIGVVLYLIGYCIIKNAQYLLDLQQEKDANKLQKKMIKMHYKYVRQCYKGNLEMWEKHQKICLYGCDKR